MLFRKLPLIEGILKFVHVLGFFAISYRALVRSFGPTSTHTQLKLHEPANCSHYVQDHGPPRHCFICLHRIRKQWLAFGRIGLSCRFERTCGIPDWCRLVRAFVRRAKKRCLDTSSLHDLYCDLKLHHLIYYRRYVLLHPCSHHCQMVTLY